MANEEMILLNELTRTGYRRLHVARMGQPPDLQNWIARLPVCSVDTLTAAHYEERTLGIYHLWLCWLARETVQLGYPDRKKWGVMWFIGKGTRFRDAAAEAAERYYLDLAKDGTMCLTQRLPTGAPDDGRIRINVLGTEIELRLREEDWVPMGYLVVEGE